jgi:hypothetical protein
MSQRGGKRPGAGRRRGSLNRRTRETIAAAEQGLTPLEYLIKVYLNPRLNVRIRLDAAKAAAPYVHPKLSQFEVQATNDLRNLTDEQCRAELVELLKDPEVQELWVGALHDWGPSMDLLR